MNKENSIIMYSIMCKREGEKINAMHQKTSIMCNIHGAPVSSFPQKKFANIHQHQYSIYNHRVSNSPIGFILEHKENVCYIVINNTKQLSSFLRKHLFYNFEEFWIVITDKSQS